MRFFELLSNGFLALAAFAVYILDPPSHWSQFKRIALKLGIFLLLFFVGGWYFLETGRRLDEEVLKGLACPILTTAQECRGYAAAPPQNADKDASNKRVGSPQTALQQSPPSQPEHSQTSLLTKVQDGARIGLMRDLFELGQFHELGLHGLPKSDVEAAKHYKQAADQRLGAAEYSLGRFHESGRGGLPKDDAIALRYYKLAAESGHAAALNDLGKFHETGRGGLRPDDGQALRYYMLAADKGHPESLNSVGQFYEQGRGGLRHNEVEALRFYKLAADKSDPHALNNLAIYFEGGRGGLTADEREAARLLRRAADLGHKPAQKALANYYEAGRGGLPVDKNEAARLRTASTVSR